MIIDSFSGKHRFLSNFYPSPIRMGNYVFLTVEHAYQASKSLDENFHYKLTTIIKPGDAKEEGQLVELRPDWEDVKLSVMERLLRQKFSNPTLMEKLIGTHPYYLIEGNTWKDKYWGVYKGEGLNHLGLLLMKIREDLMKNDTGVDVE